MLLQYFRINFALLALGIVWILGLITVLLSKLTLLYARARRILFNTQEMMSVSDVIGGYGVLVCGILIMSLSENEK